MGNNSIVEAGSALGAGDELSGRCACGTVRYRLGASPLIVHACHCRDCQRITGGPCVINMWIERKYVVSEGAAPQSFRLAGGSGKAHDVHFCGACGTYVWSFYHGAPGDALFVRAGTLENPERIRPDVHIFTRGKLPWLELPAGARAFREFYQIDEIWTAASRRGWRRIAPRRSERQSAARAKRTRRREHGGMAMLNHVSIGVKDLTRARRFYDAALGALGYKCLYESAEAAGYGSQSPVMWLLPTQSPVHADAKSGLHLCFDAAHRADVDAFHAAALKAGGHDNGKPGLRPDYGENYYVAFVVDPDGYRLEAYCAKAR